MGWEHRKRGGLYYTRSKRTSSQMVREYVGTGRLAELAAAMDAEQRRMREEERQRRKQEMQAVSTALETLATATDELLALTLSMAGYHHHKGQWRRRRKS